MSRNDFNEVESDDFDQADADAFFDDPSVEKLWLSTTDEWSIKNSNIGQPSIQETNL